MSRSGEVRENLVENRAWGKGPQGSPRGTPEETEGCEAQGAGVLGASVKSILRSSVSAASTVGAILKM